MYARRPKTSTLQDRLKYHKSEKNLDVAFCERIKDQVYCFVADAFSDQSEFEQLKGALANMGKFVFDTVSMNEVSQEDSDEDFLKKMKIIRTRESERYKTKYAGQKF